MISPDLDLLVHLIQREQVEFSQEFCFCKPRDVQLFLQQDIILQDQLLEEQNHIFLYFELVLQEELLFPFEEMLVLDLW